MKIRSYDHRDWMNACPDEYRELSIAIAKMRSKLNEHWSDGHGDDGEETIGHRPLSELADMVWEMVAGTGIPDDVDCLHGKPGVADTRQPICNLQKMMSEALHGDDDPATRRKKYAEVQALSSAHPVAYEQGGPATYRCWNCGRPSVCVGPSVHDPETVPCGW